MPSASLKLVAAGTHRGHVEVFPSNRGAGQISASARVAQLARERAVIDTRASARITAIAACPCASSPSASPRSCWRRRARTLTGSPPTSTRIACHSQPAARFASNIVITKSSGNRRKTAGQ